MIIEWVMNLGMGIIDVLFMMLDTLPNFPSKVITVINSVFDLMFSAVNLVGVFLDFSMVRTLIPIVILILNFDKIVKLIIFAVKKIPFIGIE